MNPLTAALTSTIATLLPELDAVYKDLHQHPELSMREVRTGAQASTRLLAACRRMISSTKTRVAQAHDLRALDLDDD